MEAEVQAQEGRAVVHLLFLSRCLVGKWNHSYGSWTAPGAAVCNLGTQESYQADSPAFPSFWALFGPSFSLLSGSSYEGEGRVFWPAVSVEANVLRITLVHLRHV